MWPFIPASKIDWSATVAGFSALVATAALGWNIWWSHRAVQRESLAKIAAFRVNWIEQLRTSAAELTSLLAAVADAQNPRQAVYTNKTHEISDEIKMRLYSDEYRDVQECIREMISDHLLVSQKSDPQPEELARCSKSSYEFTRLIAKVCHDEWRKAKRELSGLNA